jgi:glycerol uptake facilitator-like aquaporin
MTPTLLRRTAAEFLGTLFLLAAVVGSGIMGDRLAAGNVALALLANTLATSAALTAIILAFGAISGAHLNPAVTIASAWMGDFRWIETLAYVAAQTSGAFAGVVSALTPVAAPSWPDVSAPSRLLSIVS